MSTKVNSTTRRTGRRARRTRRQYTAMDKCQAVLAVWTERQSMSQACQRLEIAWSQLNNWQNQALDGMLAALGPKKRAEERSPELSGKLQKLLRKRGLDTEAADLVSPALQRRLSAVQKSQAQD